MVGFSADTCSVMFGSHNSVTKKLKEKVPALLTVKCTCHNSHLASSKSMALFPKVLEDFIRQLPSCFSGYKTKDGLAEFQEFCKLHNMPSSNLVLSVGCLCILVLNESSRNSTLSFYYLFHWSMKNQVRLTRRCSLSYSLNVISNSL